MSEWITYHLHLTGIVQGVGFRPKVHQWAQNQGLTGYVSNGPDGLHIIFNAQNEQKAHEIRQQILLLVPSRAHIEKITIEEKPNQHYDHFTIREPDTFPEEIHLALTPDYALCEECRKEVHDQHNRRYHYPFITCTLCGPRYSIIRELPYDRHRTTMSTYTMCKPCHEEYTNIDDRRYYSQTNSCAACGVTLSVAGKAIKDAEEIINYASKALGEGRIVAIKGIGGFLLLADATNSLVIKKLRARKHRPDKPLAVMCRTLIDAKKWAVISESAMKALTSPIAPIILLPLKTMAMEYLDLGGIAPGLNSIGIMVPYAPLFDLLLSNFGKPVVATSGNFSHAPVIYKNQQAVQGLAGIADVCIIHDRDIVVPQDDSVWRFSSRYHQKIILRRSRGMAPSFFGYQAASTQSILATGALNKSTFALLAHQQVLISQYLGNTDSLDAQESYQEVLHHLLNTLQNRPEIYLSDLHPQYFSTSLAAEMAKTSNCPLVQIQHHKAHFAAVLAENKLLSNEDPVLGVIWDGTGLGDDGYIWGGEFFLYQQKTMTRCGQMEYYPVLLGDKMAREPRLCALALGYDDPLLQELLKAKFSEAEWTYYQKLLHSNLSSMQTSSVGRLFDAVACVLGLADMQSYEGHAALLLENEAQNYVNQNGYNFEDGYADLTTWKESYWSGRTILQVIGHDLRNEKSVDYIAAKFHFILSLIIENMAQHLQVKKLAFSGGVFQNACLVDMIIWKLQDGYNLYFNQQLSPNDENISFGQLVYYDQRIDHRTLG